MMRWRPPTSVALPSPLESAPPVLAGGATPPGLLALHRIVHAEVVVQIVIVERVIGYVAAEAQAGC